MNAEQVIDRLIAEELDAHMTPDMKRVLRDERMKLKSATVSRNEDGQKAAHIIGKRVLCEERKEVER